MSVSEGLLEYCTTDHQRRIIEAVLEHGEQKKAAIALDMKPQTLNKVVMFVKRHAARKGYSPEHDWTHPAPPGYMMRGQSILYRGDGSVSMQWVKTREDVLAQWEAMQEAVAELFKQVPKAKPVPSLELYRDDLLALYPEGDPHWGMRVWGPETDGTDYDLGIALEEYMGAVEYLVNCSPETEVGICLNVGDNFHSDNPENKTRRSGHNLNVDGRLSKVFATVLEARRYKIDSMLKKHEKVVVREVYGNHDEVLCMGFTQALKGYYHNEPRVIIEDSPNAFWYYSFGKVLLGATHGDKTKIKDLPLLMANDVPELWGQSLHRHMYTGHQHHLERMEDGGVVVEMLRTLAARNEFEHSYGYRAGRDMMMRLFHKEHGEVVTQRLDINLLRTLIGTTKHAKVKY
jgi:hypothetical protein